MVTFIHIKVFSTLIHGIFQPKMFGPALSFGSVLSQYFERVYRSTKIHLSVRDIFISVRDLDTNFQGENRYEWVNPFMPVLSKQS